MRFSQGPTWDGNLCRRDERDRMVDAGPADRWNGWNFLTQEGVEAKLRAVCLPALARQALAEGVPPMTTPHHQPPRKEGSHDRPHRVQLEALLMVPINIILTMTTIPERFASGRHRRASAAMRWTLLAASPTLARQLPANDDRSRRSGTYRQFEVVSGRQKTLGQAMILSDGKMPSIILRI